jgi:hypothetical protein
LLLYGLLRFARNDVPGAGIVTIGGLALRLSTATIAKNRPAATYVRGNCLSDPTI